MTNPGIEEIAKLWKDDGNDRKVICHPDSGNELGEVRRREVKGANGVLWSGSYFAPNGTRFELTHDIDITKGVAERRVVEAIRDHKLI